MISSYLTQKGIDCSDVKYTPFISASWPLSPSFSFPFSDISCFILPPTLFLLLLGCTVYQISQPRSDYAGTTGKNNHGPCNCYFTREVTSVLSPLPLDNEHKRYVKKYNWALHGKLGVCNGYVCWHQNRIPEKNKVVLYDNYKFIQKNVIHWVCAHMVQFIWDSSRT